MNYPTVKIFGNDLFVVNYIGGTVGAYTTTGQKINTSLISGLNHPEDIAISGNDLFVLNQGSAGQANGSVGEYTTAGATVNASLISGLSDAADIAISGNDLFVANFYAGTVSEFTTAGATVNGSLISGLTRPTAIAVDTVPEPSAGALAGLGAAALWFCRRRK